MHRNKVYRETKLKTFYHKSYTSSEPEIISSDDNPFAIADTVENCLEKTKESLLISAPWIGKTFIEKVRVLPKGVEIKLLTRAPYEKDKYYHKTLRTLNSLVEVAKSKGFKLNVMCKSSYFHPKLIVSDCNIVLSGSFNPTSSGMYDNDEILYVFRHPLNVKRHIDIFNGFYNDSESTPWRKTESYHGHKDYSSYYRTPAEAIVGFFTANRNKKVDEAILCDRIVRIGYNENEVVEVVKKLLDDGILYKPEQDFLKLA